MNSDPRVTEYLAGSMTREQSDALVDRIIAGFAEHGFGLWAVEVRNGTPFAGFIGLSIPRFEAHFTPCVEVGWRLDAENWGRGYASEGARAALQFGFEVKELPEIVSFTTDRNLRSRQVMERIGMRYRAADDFAHPLLPADHPMRTHVLYRLKRLEWLARREIERNPRRLV